MYTGKSVSRQDKTRQDKIYFKSARHITINISFTEFLNRLFEKKCIEFIMDYRSSYKKEKKAMLKHQYNLKSTYRTDIL